jgi:L-ascorbate metabolism protein UlaG (beta-lactamase superfamily)
MTTLARALCALLCSVALVAFGTAANAQGGKTEVLWLGQAAFKITTPKGKVIVIDPFLTKNPKTPDQYKDLKALGHVDLILVTHGHFDHTADLPALAKLTGAKVALNADMGTTYDTLGMVDGKQMVRFNKSGPIQPLGPGITVTMVHAEHSSEVVYTDPETKKRSVHPGGEPAGYIIKLENGFTIYHAGDTGVFGDMKFIGEYYKPDLALLPIGGHFTMDPVHAAYATRVLLKPKHVVPMHYGTFPPLKGTPEEYAKALGKTSTKVHPMKPGDTLKF